MKKISLVICVFNEEENINPLVSQIHASLCNKGFQYEIIYVDDGSTDRTVKAIKALDDPRIKLLELKKNYGQSAALAAGIAEANAEYIVTMDGDLQNDPSDIPMMLDIAEKGEYDLVVGMRANRKDGLAFRKIPSNIANYLIRNVTDVRIKDYGCTLKIFRSELAKSIGLYGELHRFIPVLAVLEGGSIKQVNVKHHARKYGKSKYGMNRTLKVVSDLILMFFFQKYMSRPMHLFGKYGGIFSILGSAILLYLFILKLLGNDIWGKPLLLLGFLLLLAGIQLFTAGILAEVLMRVYYESQDKKPYKVKKISGGED